MKLRPLFLQGNAVAIIALLLDQLHKYYMLHVVQIDRPIEITPFLNFVMVWNTGISFGMFQDYDYSRYIFIIIPLIIIIILQVWLKNTFNKLEALSIGLIIGGALGNVTDRVVYGAVADFFDVHVAGYHWPAFNIADSSVFVGAAILCCYSFMKGESHEIREKNKQ